MRHIETLSDVMDNKSGQRYRLIKLDKKSQIEMQVRNYSPFRGVYSWEAVMLPFTLEEVKTFSLLYELWQKDKQQQEEEEIRKERERIVKEIDSLNNEIRGIRDQIRIGERALHCKEKQRENFVKELNSLPRV